MTKTTENIVKRVLSGAFYAILRSACASDLSLGQILEDLKQDLTDRYMRGRNVKAARPETLARWKTELEEAYHFLEKEAEDQVAHIRQRRNVVLIEYPLLAVKISDGLRKKGIPFLFETCLFENVLTLNVVFDYFLEIPVTLENVDRVVGLVPYFLHRPELAKEEVPEIRRVRNVALAREWSKRASCG